MTTKLQQYAIDNVMTGKNAGEILLTAASTCEGVNDSQVDSEELTKLGIEPSDSKSTITKKIRKKLTEIDKKYNTKSGEWTAERDRLELVLAWIGKKE